MSSSRLRALGAGRLRPRLTLTFAVVATVTAIAVASASYLVVRKARLDRATDAAVIQSQFNLDLAARTLGDSTGDALVEDLLESLQRRGGFEVVALVGGRTYLTSVSLTLSSVPPDLRRSVASGRVVAASRNIAGRPHVVVGGALQPAGQAFWFFFPLDDVVKDLGDLRQALAISALAMVVSSGVVGALAARRLLRPIASARDAARRWESGELDSRLPVEGRDEFAELSQSFNDMAAALGRTVGELRDLEAGHRRFVADVSHELRTPVTALATAADVLEPKLSELSTSSRRAGRVLVDEARRTRRLVEDLMEISRLDAGVAVVERDLVDLERLIMGTVIDHGWEQGVRVGDVQRVVVVGDRRRLDSVFTNLIDNALRHGRPPVEVEVDLGETEVVVEVRDHGPGIPDEHVGRVFDRFYKVDQARGRSESSGLGLAIARENVLLHGGRISAANAEEGGVVFRVSLPLASDVAEPLPIGDEALKPALLDQGDRSK